MNTLIKPLFISFFYKKNYIFRPYKKVCIAFILYKIQNISQFYTTTVE